MTRKVALVTGASRGIGAAVARALGADWHVLVGGRDADAVAAVCAELPSAEPFLADLTDLDEVAGAVEGLTRLDAVVHSAGVATYSRVADTDPAEWRRLFDVNVVAVAHLTRLLLPALRASSGIVVAINSGAGHRSSPGAGPYCASKFALRALTDALREEERGRVRVCSIHPGRVDTDMQRGLWAGSGKPYRGADHLSADDVAATVALALSLPPTAVIDELTIRPAEGVNP